MISRYRVGIVVSRIDFGAAELLEFRLAIELSKLGIETFIFPQYSEKKFNDINYEERIKNYNIKLVRINFDSLYKSFYNIIKIRNLNLDFIISHNRGGDILATFITIFKRTKHIKAFHEYYNNEIKFSLINVLWKISIKQSNFSYHISRYVQKKNKEIFNLKYNNSTIIDNAIDYNVRNTPFSLEKFSIPKNKKIILTVARLVEYKGYKNNFDIIIPIIKKRKDTIYVFAGDNSEDLSFFNEINKRIKKNNLKNKVFYLGEINNIISLMRKSKVLLHCPNREGFGLILLEALYADLPIVASDVGGIPELLRNTGYKTFPISNISKARILIENYLDSNKIIKNDLEKIKKKYSHKRRAKNVIKIFDKLSK